MIYLFLNNEIYFRLPARVKKPIDDQIQNKINKMAH